MHTPKGRDGGGGGGFRYDISLFFGIPAGFAGWPDAQLSAWLLVTDMIFAGDAPDIVKLGTMNALAKDLERFRPITLLEPIYKCVMATFSRRLMEMLHN